MIPLAYIDWGELARKFALYLLLIAVTFAVCFPLVWAFATSLKPTPEIFTSPPTWTPATVTTEHYASLIHGKPMYFQTASTCRTRPRPSTFCHGSPTA